MKHKGKFLIAGICAFLTLLLIASLYTVGVAAIGPQGTLIGMSFLNQRVYELIGVNYLWHRITEGLGVLAILTAAAFAALGCAQLVRRRSLRKVDPELVCLGGLYVVILALYAFFKKVVVNYRPVIMPGSYKPEASFPSSHTLMACVVMGSAMMLLGRYIKSKALCAALRALCALVLIVTVVGRFLSGVHWFTDILGGLLISGMLLALFAGILSVISNRENRDMKDGDIVIRRETEADYRAVEELVRESFWNVYRPGCLEHFVLHRLRSDPAFVKELDFVMERDGALIGQNVFMRAAIRADDGRDVPIMTMGPICITPALKRQGYGKRLLDYSLEQAAALGCGAVCFEGNIDFYGKSGFTYAGEFGIRYHDLPEGADASFFLCRELIPGYLADVTGEYGPPEGYFVGEREPEAFEAFDATFPPKEKLKLPGQLV